MSESLRPLLADPEGLEFLRWLLLEVCGIMRSPMAGTGGDISYLCGKQDVGYQLLPHLIAINPSFLTLLMETPDVPE